MSVRLGRGIVSGRSYVSSGMLVLHKVTVRCHAAQLAIIKQMSRQVSRGSAGDYQADEKAGVARLSWRVSGS